YITPTGEFHFVVADSGRMADTRTAINTVTKMLTLAPRKIQSKIEKIGEITYLAREALEKSGKQLLGTLLNEAQKELKAIGVSDSGLNKLVEFALSEDALGAKLTGGGNGGCIIALAESEEHSLHLTEKLKQFGAHAVWPFSLKSNN